MTTKCRTFEKIRAFLALFFPFLLLSLSTSSTAALKLNLVQPPQGRTLESYQALGAHAMVGTSNTQASQIGLDILKKGGNAADAAIAVSFALSVLRPQSTGIGGGGFLLFYNKEASKTIALDFREKAPIKATKDMYVRNGKPDTKLSQDGALAVAVPRLVAGLGYVYEHYASGKIAWADLIRPSISLAENGFAIYPQLANALKERKKILARFESSKRIFLPRGKLLKEGEIVVQKDLAKTLTTIAEKGWKSFYQGEIALQIVKTIQRHGGILTLDDFQNVEPVEMESVTGSYRGYKIVSMPPPSSGGTILIEILNILEKFPLQRQGAYALKTIHEIAEAMKLGFRDRAKYLGDPRFVAIPVAGLIDKDYAKKLSQLIDPKQATPSSKLSEEGLPFKESNSTTHFSIVDQDGNAVSSTQTINYIFGSGVVAAGTGIVLNDEMDDFSLQPGVPNVFGLVGSEANAVAAGKTPLSSMTPTLVFDPHGELKMVVGSPGGPRIITAVLDTILNSIDFHATPLQAVAAKRLHHQWLPDKLEVEPGLLSLPLRQKLEAMGHPIEEVTPSWLVMLVAKTKKGWVGVSDPRGVGAAMGY